MNDARLEAAARRRRFRTAVAAAVIIFAAAGLAACEVVPGEPVEFSSGHGIEVHGFYQLAGSERTWVIDVSSDNIDPGAVNGFHQIFVTLPSNYLDNGAWRFPVLYLLHGGGGGRSSDWVLGAGDAEAITEEHSLITVMPDGGKVGWYTNWVNTAQGAQAWQDFHLNQLVPWIDANLRTAAIRESRAVAGLSMGGYGAIRYATERPDLFSYTASFSGAIDVSDARTRLVTVQQTAANGLPSDGPFGTHGQPNSTWEQYNPTNRAGDLADVRVALYTGPGVNFLDLIEGAMADSARKMHDRLNAEGIDHFYWNYGTNPQGSPYSCNGGHNFGCWNFALDHVMPDMMDHLLGPPPPG